MSSVDMSTGKWAEDQFGDCHLGDARRTQRLVEVASQVANDPSGSFPEQTETWRDLKAAYRLFDCSEVTFEAIATPHFQHTRAGLAGRYLILGDTTEIDIGRGREVAGLGPTGNGGGYGFLVHSGLMIDAETEEIIGLSAQTIHYRQPVPEGETRAQRLARDKESQVWGKVIDQTGRPAEGVQYVHVFDRGADNFEVYCHLVNQGDDWVVRASQLHRKILTATGEKKPLSEYLAELTVAGTYEMDLRARPTQPARRA